MVRSYAPLEGCAKSWDRLSKESCDKLTKRDESPLRGG